MSVTLIPDGCRVVYPGCVSEDEDVDLIWTLNGKGISRTVHVVGGGGGDGRPVTPRVSRVCTGYECHNDNRDCCRVVYPGCP